MPKPSGKVSDFELSNTSKLFKIAALTNITFAKYSVVSFDQVQDIIKSGVRVADERLPFFRELASRQYGTLEAVKKVNFKQQKIDTFVQHLLRRVQQTASDYDHSCRSVAGVDILRFRKLDQLF